MRGTPSKQFEDFDGNPVSDEEARPWEHTEDDGSWTYAAEDAGDKLALEGTDATPAVFIGTFIREDLVTRGTPPEMDENGEVLMFARVCLRDRTGSKCWMWQNSRIKTALASGMLTPGCDVRIVSYGKRINPKNGQPFHRMEVQVRPASVKA